MFFIPSAFYRTLLRLGLTVATRVRAAALNDHVRSGSPIFLTVFVSSRMSISPSPMERPLLGRKIGEPRQVPPSMPWAFPRDEYPTHQRFSYMRLIIIHVLPDLIFRHQDLCSKIPSTVNRTPSQGDLGSPFQISFDLVQKSMAYRRS